MNDDAYSGKKIVLHPYSERYFNVASKSQLKGAWKHTDGLPGHLRYGENQNMRFNLIQAYFRHALSCRIP